MSAAPFEAHYAAIARDLADALMDYAYTRKPEDKARVHGLHLALTNLRKEEQTAPESTDG